MKAENLLGVFEFFEIKPLEEEDEIKNYYEKRESPIKSLSKAILLSKKPAKFLFSGHRGSGKSTELNILSGKVKDKYFVVNFSVFDLLSIHDIKDIDLLLTIGSEIYKKAYDEGIKLDKKIVNDLSAWMEDVTKISIKEQKVSLGGEAALNWLLIKLGSEMQTGTTKKEELRGTIKQRLGDLMEKINSLIYEVENKLAKKEGKKILVIIDDLDKIDLDEAEELFYKHSNSLTLPACSIVYTIPISLVHSSKYTQVKLSFANSYVLPNIRLNKKDGGKDEAGREILRKVAGKRMDLNLISGEALEKAIDGCGGDMFQFIYIIRFASIEADNKNRSRIEKDDVSAILVNLRNDFDRILKKDDYPILKEIHKTKDAVDGERLLELFHSLSVLEYLNEERWCDIHPLIIPLLDK